MLTLASRVLLHAIRALNRRRVFRVFHGLIVSAVLAGVAFSPRGAASSEGPVVLPNGDVRVQGAGVQPQLFFACDLKADQVEPFFSDPAIIADLKDLNAGVALGIEDFSPARALVVRQLNQAGIPVIAWLVLPPRQGYYMNAGNALEAAARFVDFQDWTEVYGLKWSAVGLDIEPDSADFAVLRDHKLSGGAKLLWRSVDTRRLTRARKLYSSLIRNIRAAGYPVQTYQLIFLADERKARTTVLERAFGIVDVKPDVEVLMTYSSFNHAADGALLLSYAPEAQAVAVGSTAGAGDAAIDTKFPPLDWDEFSRDLIIASHFSRVVGVYNLQGCVRQGFLDRLKTLDWSQSVTVPSSSIQKVAHFRHVVATILWTAELLPYFLAAIVVILILLIVWPRRAKKRASPA